MTDDRSRRRFLAAAASLTGTAIAGCANLSGRANTDRDGTGTDDSSTTQTTPADTPRSTPADTPQSTPTTPEETPPLGGTAGGVDDWQYTPPSEGTGGTATATPQATSMEADSVGLAAGGAKDIATFRRNVEEGYLPLPESLSYEGLFYNYYFDTAGDGSCSSLFCPSYAPAVTRDPLSGDTERYFTVGLDSGLDASEFDRKRLNLVVVLDISGSMSSPFSEYYYDRYGNKQTPEGDTDRPKIAVARDALVALTEQLRPADRLGIVLYNNQSAVAKPMRKVEDTDMAAIRNHIQEDIEATGGTNLSAGVADATDLLAEYEGADPATDENRMIVLTDAMPNLGTTAESGLETTLSDNAARNVNTTFVGVGVDFNTELVDGITDIRGANYYAVHSADEFERRLSDQFGYMVTPLVYDLELEVDADGYDIEKVYGSTAAEEATGQIMNVNTLFASPKKDGQTRGGIVLVKVSGQSDDATIELNASWEDRTGTTGQTSTTLEFPGSGPEQFATTGVRKGVLLSRYADLLKNWMIDERRDDTPDDGIEVPPENLGQWEQQSDPLTVSDAYERRIREFEQYFRSEMNAIGDDSLDQELETLSTILEQDPE